MNLKAKALLVLLLLVLISSSAKSQYKSLELTETTQYTLPKPKLTLKPVAKFDDMVGQFVGGNLAGGLVGLGGACLGLAIDKANRNSHSEWIGYGTIIGLVAGHCAGSIVGVYGIGSSKDVTGDVGATILGGVLGTGTSILVLSNTPSPVVGWSTLSYPTIGAMIGFNSTLSYKDMADKKNVSELKDLGTHFKIKNDFEVNLVKVNFQLPNAIELSKIPESFLLALK